MYTFYEPALPARSLGTYAILRQIELARERGIPYLYLGYWIANYAKMHYKARFRPLEVMRNEEWRILEDTEP